MVNHLLDLNDRKTPGDQFPPSYEPAKMFNLKFRWVVSIGFALRTDVAYLDDISSYGTCEAERKSNWVISRYPKMKGLMDQHVLIPNLYGPGTTWFTRKQLTYQSPKVSGPGWIAIGDAVGFTNLLFSPGINANIDTSVSEVLMGWDWGVHEDEYVTSISQAITLLDGPPSKPPTEVIVAVLALSDMTVRSAVVSGKYKNRWAGLLRWYNGDLEFCEDKDWKDILSCRCKQCGNWRIFLEDLLKCAVCGGLTSAEEAKKVLVGSRKAAPKKTVISLRCTFGRTPGVVGAAD